MLKSVATYLSEHYKVNVDHLEINPETINLADGSVTDERFQLTRVTNSLAKPAYPQNRRTRVFNELRWVGKLERGTVFSAHGFSNIEAIDKNAYVKNWQYGADCGRNQLVEHHEIVE